MRRRFRHLLCGAAAAALFAALAAPAHAQDGFARAPNEAVRERAHPDYDPRGLRFGGFDARPSLEIGLEATDNLFASETAAEDDLIYSLRPRLEIASHWSRHKLAGEIGGRATYHQDFGGEDATEAYAGAEFRLDILRTTEAGIALRAEKNIEPRTSPDAPPTAGEPVEYAVHEARVHARHAFNRVRIGGSYEERAFDFDDARDASGVLIDQDDRDRTERTATARLELALTPRVALVGQAAANERDYDIVTPALNRNSEGRTYLVGANFDVTRLIRGEVTAGHFEQDYEDPALGTLDGVAVAAKVDWFPTQLTTVSANAQRQAEDAGFTTPAGGAASYLLSRGGVRVDHELRRNVILSAGVEGGRREYRGLDREDEVFAADLGGRYLMNRNVVIGGGYRFEREQSSGAAAGREYEVNRLFVTFGLRI